MEVTCKFKLYERNELFLPFTFSVITALFLTDGLLFRVKSRFEYGMTERFNLNETVEKFKGKTLCLDVEYYNDSGDMIDLKRYDYLEMSIADEDWFDLEDDVNYLWLKPSMSSECFLWRMRNDE